MRLLLIEDDPLIAESLSDALRFEGFTIDHVSDGEQALAAMSTLGGQSYDALLLDIGLPKRDGFSVLKALRSKHIDTPVLILTARDGVADRIHGLNLGADDYLVKPFDLGEAIARIQALLRRSVGLAGNHITLGSITLNTTDKQATLAGETIALSAKEYVLLHLFASRPDAVFSRSELEDKLYGWGEEVESNAVEFLIHSLRKKLGKGSIKNVRGMGWYGNSKYGQDAQDGIAND